MESKRLNKYISESGICSRREADRFIEKGLVFINGKRAVMGDQAFPTDTVKVNGMVIEPKPKEEAIYLAFNKPRGITCTTDTEIEGNIVDYIGFGERIFPIGRLDKDSQGLIFMTSNGDIVNKILRAGNKHEKEYIVTVNKAITDQFIQRMGNGIPVLGQTTKKCKVERISPFVFRIILVQGLNRQIRRMCEYLGYEVQKLERIRIMNISLTGIPLGAYRAFSPSELKEIEASISNSSNDVLDKKQVSSSKKSSKSIDSRKKRPFKPSGNSAKKAAFSSKKGGGQQKRKK